MQQIPLSEQVITKKQAQAFKKFGLIQKSLFYFYDAPSHDYYLDTYENCLSNYIKITRKTLDSKGWEKSLLSVSQSAYTLTELHRMAFRIDGAQIGKYTVRGGFGHEWITETKAYSVSNAIFKSEAQSFAAILLLGIRKKIVTVQTLNKNYTDD